VHPPSGVRDVAQVVSVVVLLRYVLGKAVFRGLLLNATTQVPKIGPDRTSCVQMYGHSWSGDLDRAGPTSPQTDRRNPGTPAPVFAASSPTPTPSRAVKFGTRRLDCVTMLRAYHVRTRCPRSAVQGRLAAAYVSDSELPLSENQTENSIFAASLMPSTPLRAVKFGDAPLYDAVNARAMSHCGYMICGRPAPETLCQAAWRRHRRCRHTRHNPPG